MPYNSAADSFTQRNSVADFLQTKCDFRPKLAVLHFWGATYNDHLRLIGKHVVNFLLVLIELFSLGVTAEVLRANIGLKLAISLQRGPVNRKISRTRGCPLSNHSSSQKTRLNDLSYGIKIWIDLASVLSQSTCLDRRTDKQTDRRADRQLSHRYTASAFHAARWKLTTMPHHCQESEQAINLETQHNLSRCTWLAAC